MVKKTSQDRAAKRLRLGRKEGGRAAVPVGEEGGGCRTDACGIFTCNNHTALGDWVQDVYLPVAFG